MSGTYLNSVISKYHVNTAGAQARVNAIYPTIQQWGGAYINESIYTGSIAKGTSVSLTTDADLFISLSSTTPDTLAQIYNSLYTALATAGYQPRRQNVSIGVNSGGFKIDFVPGKRQSQYGYDHSLYKNKAQTWTKTNVKTHVSKVASSNRLNEIKLTKIWRSLFNLDFPSFYLELAVIDCLAGCSTTDLAGNFWTVLTFLSSSFPTRSYTDPANTANIISRDLTQAEKLTIKNQAKSALTKTNWNQIVW